LFPATPRESVGVLCFLVAGVVLSVLLGPRLGWNAALFAAVPVLGAVVFAIWPGRVTIGADGVYARCLHRHRFIPYAEIERVSLYQLGTGRSLGTTGVDIDARPPLHIRFTENSYIEKSDAKSMVSEIQRGMRAIRQHAGPPQLERGKRAAGAWVAHLRSLGMREGDGYRAAPLDDEVLLETLDDANQPARMRVAAAVVLRARGDEEHRTRIRHVVSASASEVLREALERAEKGDDDDELARALDALDEGAAASQNAT
jgi:hypothetical protein